MPFSRRDLLRASAAGSLTLPGALTGGGLLAPRAARAASTAGGSDLKFLFVMAYGGWDTTRCLTPMYDNPVVDHEADGAPTAYGDLTIVDHPERPSVTEFFSRYYERSLILNGLLVPSVAHSACMRMVMTGFSTGAHHPDWAAALAAPLGDTFTLPHLVISGPSYPGPYSAYVTRTGSSGQLDALLTGELLSWSDIPTAPADLSLEALERDFMGGRIERALASARGPRRDALIRSLEIALQRGTDLKSLQDVINWSPGVEFYQQLGLAVEIFREDLARCVTVQTPNFWDTHAMNERYQNWYWEDLFEGLLHLINQLESTPGHATERLVDETVIVILSEMGRAPGVNSQEGKDHWPYTSAMLIGPGITGDRVVGGYDELVYGLKIDPTTCEPDPEGLDLSCDMIGATLLQLAGEDYREHLPDALPLEDVLL